MQENYELVQKGFRILHPLMAGYIGREFNRVYHDNWWQEVLDTLSDQLRDLPDHGDYSTLVDSLDIANCLRLIDRNGGKSFPQNCLLITVHGLKNSWACEIRWLISVNRTSISLMQNVRWIPWHCSVLPLTRMVQRKFGICIALSAMGLLPVPLL